MTHARAVQTAERPGTSHSLIATIRMSSAPAEDMLETHSGDGLVSLSRAQPWQVGSPVGCLCRCVTVSAAGMSAGWMALDHRSSCRLAFFIVLGFLYKIFTVLFQAS
jgi:hypothetical protein